MSFFLNSIRELCPKYGRDCKDKALNAVRGDKCDSEKIIKRNKPLIKYNPWGIFGETTTIDRITTSNETVRNYSGCVCPDPCEAKKLMDIKCKIALITGGNSGIGLAIADELLACGLKKAFIGGRDCERGMKAQDKLIKKHGFGTAEFIRLDVLNNKQFEDAFKYAVHKEGSVDILVNNAGILADSDWEKELDINVKGVYRGVLLANKYMSTNKKKGACVVNIASVVGFDASEYIPAYTGTKHAVVGLTKSLGSENQFKKNGLRHIALCPGLTDTPIITEISEHQLDPHLGKMFYNVLKNSSNQKASAVGKSAVYTVEYGPPGSLWIVQGSKLARMKQPHRTKYLKKIMDL